MSELKQAEAVKNHYYPGLGLALRHHEQSDYNFYPIGAHGSCYGSDSDLIFLRELAMMDVMEKLTDKPDWHKKVFNEEIVAKWRKEALAIPDEEFWKIAISAKSQWFGNDSEGVQLHDDDPGDMPENILDTKAFDCCIQELQSKAKYFEKTGIVPSLEATASVAKSDSLVSPQLHEALRQAFDKLKSDNAASPDWHPDTNDMVHDLVHPSMYPLVYGRSRVFKEECVGVSDAIQRWAGKGSVIPREDPNAGARDNYRYGVGSGNVPPEYWSDTYQWLPANVAFRKDGRVQFTSYINNLHPNRYPDIYQTIEQFIQTSLPMWDQCLAMATDYDELVGAGRTKTRMGPPVNADDDNEANWIPSDKEECADVEVSEEDLENQGWEPEFCDAEELTEYKWKAVRKAKMPEVTFKDIEYAPKDERRLVNLFRENGLQIIVKLASIELTPEKPEFPVGGWHIEGQMNEHICGTALYYLDSENITSSSLSFRMQTSAYLNDDDNYNVGQDQYHWMESVFGTNLGVGNSACLQNYGTVETRPGRLLTFPNVLQHRVSPFKLVDPTKPGHRRFIALWLVDPTKRIISTANVPPQQMTWYADSILGSTPEAKAESATKLPAELVNLFKEKGVISQEQSGSSLTSVNAVLPEELMGMVRDYFDANGKQMPMSVEEAKKHREDLMKERGAFRKTAEHGWREHTYGFCEH